MDRLYLLLSCCKYSDDGKKVKFDSDLCNVAVLFRIQERQCGVMRKGDKSVVSHYNLFSLIN